MRRVVTVSAAAFVVVLLCSTASATLINVDFGVPFPERALCVKGGLCELYRL